MRYMAFVAILTVFTSSAMGQTFLLNGQITAGTSLFPENDPAPGTEYDAFGLPVGGYPVDYQAKLIVDQGVGLWGFAFSANDAVETVQYTVDGPVDLDRGTTNEVVVTQGRVELDFFRFASLTTDFGLNLDLEAETGAWNWSQDCPVCDLQFALPGATATVTSIRVVPEPHSVSLTVTGSTIALLFRRRRR